jgi:hypothetical protein
MECGPRRRFAVDPGKNYPERRLVVVVASGLSIKTKQARPAGRRLILLFLLGTAAIAAGIVQSVESPGYPQPINAAASTA